MSIHDEASPLAGMTVSLIDGCGVPGPYRVEDYWDRVTGGSWMSAEGNPAALKFAMRTAFAAYDVPLDNEVLYGKCPNGFGHLVHVSEVQS